MRSRNNVTHDQMSVWFPVEESEPRLNLDKPFAGMKSVYLDTLPRDISAHVMPTGGSSRARKNFTITIEPRDEEFEGVIARGLDRRGSSYHADLPRAVCNFFQQTASQLMRDEKAVFEIVLLRDRTSKEVVGFDFFGIDVRSLTFKREAVIQTVPNEWATQHKVPTKIELDHGKLVVFSLPTEFENLSETKDALTQMGGAALVRMYETTQADNKLGYDAKEHIRAEHLAIAAATRATGWSANQNLYELFTEYYVLYRRLVFERSIISLRESILGTLNDGLQRVAAEFKKTAKLGIYGLPTIDDVNRAMGELSTGNRTFGSVLDDFSLL
jgi:hypothetical protein